MLPPQSPSTTTSVYLSPHLDDAALSCGGQIRRQTRAGLPVLVITLCAGVPASENTSPFAESLHARWRVPAAQAVAARRAEDLAALAELGAAALHLDVPDCIYRVSPATGEARYASEESLWGALHPEEAELAQRCAGILRAQLQRLPAARWYAPLGLGHHVDHQLARRAAELAFPVWAYYEDYPYADREANLSPHSKVSGDETLGLAAEVVPLVEADLQAKCRAVAAYTSQLSTFWESTAAMEASLAAYAACVGAGSWAERFWRAPSTAACL
jgi:LmbE family N-acetylglucosaminyl deacetylase